MKQSIPTLYEWAGGNEVLEKLTRVFYDKVFKDELLYPVFKNMSPDHFTQRRKGLRRKGFKV